MNFLIRRLQLDLVPTSPQCAILMLRIALGVQMLLGHGWGKLMSFSDKAATFPDPLGVGHTTSMALAVFGEVVCMGLLIVGAFTRLSALCGAVTMAVAFFLVHGGKLRGCAVSISEIGALLYQACDRKEGRTHGCGRGSSVWVCGLPRR